MRWIQQAWWSCHLQDGYRWLLAFLLGTGCGFSLFILQGGLQPDVSRPERATWRASQSQWLSERDTLYAEIDRLRDESHRAKAWINTQQQTLALSHARLDETHSARHVCERLLDTLMTATRR